MKKLLPVIIIVIILLIAGVGYFMFSKKGTTSMMPSNANPVQGGSVFSSIQDALSKSLSLQCSFTDETGRSTTAYIKAGAVRADIVGKDPSQAYNSSSVIVKDNKLYMWDTVKKQGMVMQMNPQDMKAPTGGTVKPGSTGGTTTGADMMAALEKYKNDCKPAVVSDSLFSAPTDVTFSDLSKMMEPTSGSEVVPTGAMNQQQVQEMMQKYQNQGQQNNTGY